MAMDTKQKRMSALNLGKPWRGPLVDAPEAGFTQGNRQAADFFYSGILAAAPEAPSAVTWVPPRFRTYIQGLK